MIYLWCYETLGNLVEIVTCPVEFHADIRSNTTTFLIKTTMEPVCRYPAKLAKKSILT